MTASTVDPFNPAARFGTEFLIARPHWLYVIQLPIAGMIAVWRSVELRDDDDWYVEAMALVGDAELFEQETEEDDHMIGGEAEVALYAVPA